MDLSGRNTFGMKVRAARYVEYDNALDLKDMDWAALKGCSLHIGEGSNLLFTGDYPGTVLRSRIKGKEVLDRSAGDDIFVRVGAGEVMDDFIHWAAMKGLWGVENLSAIPGSVGASAVQNVGAYGVQAGELIDSVECFDTETGEFVTLSAAECSFAYRDSLFKHNRGRYVVVYVIYHLYQDFRPCLEYGNLREEVERNVELVHVSSNPYQPALDPMKLVPDMPLTPMLVRDTVKIIRESKLPDPSRIGSAGSFFKNPVVEASVYEHVCEVCRESRGADATVPHYDLPDGLVKIPAAWLIDFCGFKGAEQGGASVWAKQPLVIVNTEGKATPEDVITLENRIIDTIRSRFGITLEAEVDHI